MLLPRSASLCACLLSCAPFALHAQPGDETTAADVAPQARELDTVRVTGTATNGFRSRGPAQVGKSGLAPGASPQSVSVVTRDLLDAQQAQSLADALHNVPGVVSNTFGRRGWDDLIIRGQVASDSLFVDGLRTAASSRVAEQLFGYEQVEVLKGPASLMYGLVLPGGLVNMVSKRPQADRFDHIDTTIGSHGLVQGTFDLNTPLSADGKAALRLNGLAMNSDDATDHVWFRARHIAPALSLDLGPDTDLTLLASYQTRQYLRQQGLPLVGSILPSRNGPIPRDTFTGEPGQDPYRARQSRIGYAFSHRFGNGWTLNQNLRVQDFEVTGQLVSNTAMNADQRTLRRGAQDQAYDGHTLSVDTHAWKQVATGALRHDLTFGVDYLDTREDVLSYTCTVAALNVYAPVYGSPIRCPATPRTNTRVLVEMLGLYARDQLHLGERWLVSAGLRRDFTTTRTTNRANGRVERDPADATAGALAVMYDLTPAVRPYLSYATSFYPNTGTDVDGRGFEPEEGRQWEAGLKIDLAQGRATLTTALFDLRRQHVLQGDPLNDGFSIAIGEQRTRGAELGIAADLGHGLSLNAGYAYTDAVITDDGGQAVSTVGNRLNNVPRHSATAFARYQLPGAWSRWSVNGGMRGESDRFAYSYTLPAYVVADAGVAYDAPHWHAAFSLKNIFDTHYYSGGLAAAVAMGDDRTAMFNLGLRF
ncbi:TonB-dependent siderophore receptor [Pseudoxanthomonas winnipegensis]|uniref:TonB-dependent siderophore receptor n=1 Tax=Pseudoxanthomonas winnipegensis TaxID=2480810 RepID=A0A4V2HFH0_9GAMM|nr:TonB-dependent siderophore receptor [Pseudoxanthomonas winnipegensis]RZZ90292.1 TonB-dependent siderophore receptor [Pseudoxanthomonas winnipegensis]TAA37551.1 TonB-dependent siderophore receptor [Pseudoxanthomonas winnipegensis]